MVLQGKLFGTGLANRLVRAYLFYEIDKPERAREPNSRTFPQRVREPGLLWFGLPERLNDS